MEAVTTHTSRNLWQMKIMSHVIKLKPLQTVCCLYKKAEGGSNHVHFVQKVHSVVKSVFLDRKVHTVKHQLGAGQDLLGSCELFFSNILFLVDELSLGLAGIAVVSTPKEATVSLLHESNAQ